MITSNAVKPGRSKFCTMEGNVNTQIVLRSIEDGTPLAASQREIKLTPHWNARSVTALGCCWLAYVVVSTESSVLGPFFPSEVVFNL